MKFRSLFAFLMIGLLLSGCSLIGNSPEEESSKDYARGVQNFSVLLKGVGMQVNLVSLRPSEQPGYTYVVLNVDLVNQSADPVIPESFLLVDDSLNQYVSQKELPFESELNRLPLFINKGDDGATGDIVFEVPNGALNANLRMQWDSEPHQSTIEIFLGALPEA